MLKVIKGYYSGVRVKLFTMKSVIEISKQLN